MLFRGVFPDRLKYAIIKPLHKNGDRCDVSKYRPVSLLTSFSKIFETLMQGRILKHLTKYNILSIEQYGFRLGLRIDNVIHILTTEILNAVNNKLLVGAIFCYLEKAFDCVNHDILLSKLKCHGISDKDCGLYHSYLDNRFCRLTNYL
jgi:exoribonuclease II